MNEEAKKDSGDSPNLSNREVIVGGVLGWILIIVALASLSRWIDG